MTRPPCREGGPQGLEVAIRAHWEPNYVVATVAILDPSKWLAICKRFDPTLCANGSGVVRLTFVAGPEAREGEMQSKFKVQTSARVGIRRRFGAASAVTMFLSTAVAQGQEQPPAAGPTAVTENASGDAAATESETPGAGEQSAQDSEEAVSSSAGASFSLGAGGQADASAQQSSATDGGEQPASSKPQIPPYAGARATRTETSLGARYAPLPYIERYKPEPNLWEVTMFGGLLFPSGAHNLKVAVLPREEFSAVAGQLGGSLAYFPLSFVGLELEGMGAGGSTRDSNFSAVLYGIRAHAIVQLPLFSVVPFALIGGGTMGASTETMGHDRDGAFHYGVGVKVPVNHRVSGRFDFRDNLTQKGEGAANGKQTHHPELHLGVTFTFERTPPPVAPDRDYDGLYDHEDQCPDQGALTASGCPSDSDGDGILDPVDECPAVAGVEPTGCPNLDEDGDGVPIPVDQCPEEMASTPDGCPDQDLDGDGIIGQEDKCPKKPETRNGFEDDDGCPDEMPEAVQRFTGVIQGINFRQGTSEIEESSFPTLDSAVEILAEFPSIRIEVSGHTSSEGAKERNDELSIERAEAVRTYFVNKGIGEDRITARGAGSSEPVADNATKEGREKNRRIEFRILSQP